MEVFYQEYLVIRVMDTPNLLQVLELRIDNDGIDATFINVIISVCILEE